MSKVKVPIFGTVGKAVIFDPQAGARAEAAVAALAAQISAGTGSNIRHAVLQGLQVGDDHPQYTMWQAPETIVATWNFQAEPDIEGIPLTEFIEDVVGGELVEDSTSISWTYGDTANTLQAHIIDEYVQDLVGAMLLDTTSIDLAYNDSTGKFTASIIDEYVQDLVGAMLVDTATVDFTYDDTLGQISATVPGAALTKVDDTNVTLTLGGSASTALARAASLTLGWTGQLAVARGGSGAATLTGYLKGNGTAAFTASATVPGSDIDGAALTKVDDTNVTLTLGGTPATSLLRAASLTLGWTGQLSVARGGTGNSALAALTKVDDTNVTLTLGGSPATALVNAASLTLGWTGQLAVTRGGTGLATVAQGDLLYGSASNTLSALAKNTTATRYLSNTGTSNNPAWAQVDLTNGVTGTLPAGNLPGSFNGFANPSASVGLTAVNGSAATAMRSDAAPALSQSITPEWTGTHGWADNAEIQLGTGNDLRLFHDGTNSIIRNDTGHLLFYAGATEGMRFTSSGGLQIGTNSGADYALLAYRNTTTDACYIRQDGTGGVYRMDGAGGSLRFSADQSRCTFGVPANLKSYTVATLPTGTQGDTACVTDATAPTYLGALTGGGTVKCPVFYNGAAWVSC